MRWALVFLVACAAAEREHAPSVPELAAAVAALPEPPGALAPALTRVESPSGERLADVDACGNCHADVASQWRKSAHAFASFNNPIYRAAVDKVRRDRGERTSHFCGGCHDPSLLVDGAMLQPIAPADLRAHAGVTCPTCHGIAEARTDGNGSYDLDASPIPVPREGDPESVLRHRARVGRATLRTSAMCNTCHKAFLDEGSGNAAHLTGQDDATPWARSAFAGSRGARIDDAGLEKDCRGCHMPRVPAVLGDPGAKHGTVASHAFLGGHTWLGAMQGDAGPAQAFLAHRVQFDVGGLRHASGAIDDAAPAPGERVTIDVVVRNLEVGHRFPGGVMDAQDTWIELVVEDVRGRVVASAGTTEEATGADPTAHTLSSYMAHADGTRALVRETHEFKTGVWNHTVPPRDAAVVGFTFTAPAEGHPLRVTARLRHRSRGLVLQRAACEETRSPRGRAFGQVGLAKVARAIDACLAQPVTDLGAVRMVLGAPRPPSFERAYAYGMGLSHALQEHLDDARIPLGAALAEARSPRDRALALGMLANVAARQGRVDETFALAADAERAAKEAGLDAIAMQRARADVLASTWRLTEAAPLYLDVARASPRDDAAWVSAAVTLAGAGDRRGALLAARTGLVLQPRDGDLLRVQALSLPEPSAAAEAAFLERRPPDDAPAVRSRCSMGAPGCALERVPVHAHAMR